jgi:iron complex outermembrane recepter protein
MGQRSAWAFENGPLLGALVALASVSAHAQSTPAKTDSGDQLQEIVVTAQKRAESLQEVPTAITALSSAELQQLGVTQFSDYMDLVPGLAQNSAGVPGHGLVILRGLSTGSQQTASTVAYLIDDVPFTANSSLAIGSLLTPDPDLTDIERIEVLKGPQGTLYGASALGGIIKIVSKQPTADAFSGEVHATYQSVDHGGNGEAFRASMNIPIIENMVSMRFSAFERTDPGYITNSQLNEQDTNKSIVSGGRLALRIQPTENLDITFSGFVQDLRAEGASSIFANPATLSPLYCRYCSLGAINPFYGTQYRIGSMVVNWTTPVGTVTNSMSYAKYSDQENFDYTPVYGILNTLYGLPVPPNTAVIGALYPSMRKLTEELRFASVRFGNFESLAGLFFTREGNEYNVALTNEVPPSFTPVPAPFDNFLLSNTAPLYKEYAAFADLTYYFLPNLDLTVGGRYTHNEQTSINFASGILNGDLETHNVYAASESPATYLATLRYRPIAELDTYARVASGFRPGGPQLTQGAGLPQSFRPDTTVNYELGAKGRWLDGRATSNIALYWIDWRNVQLNELVNGLQVQGNGGKATSKGIELELAFLPVRGLTTQLSASFDHAYTNVAVPVVGALAGDTMPYAPRFTGAALADYEFPITEGLKGFVGSTYSYQGGRPTSWSHDPLNTNYNLPGFGTIDARAGLDFGQYKLALRAENVTDKYAYSTSIVDNIFPGQGAAAQPVLIKPRTFYAEISAKF